MERALLTLKTGTTCSSWNYCGLRLATGSDDGFLTIYDTSGPDSSEFIPSFHIKVHEAAILKVIWVPPEYGDAIASICSDGKLSLLDEIVEDNQPLTWKICVEFKGGILNSQFGFSKSSLKLVTTHVDGHAKVYELIDPLDLSKWQFQAEFSNAVELMPAYRKACCISASISWKPRRLDNKLSSFVMGFNSDISHYNSAKVWEFDEAHIRWLPVAELALPDSKDDQVYAVAWAPNIGRPYEIIAVGTQTGIAIWHLHLHPNADGKLSAENIALLSGHEGKVWQMEWDMSGMTLATSGANGVVRLWQSNLHGVWHEQAVLTPTP